MYMKLTGAEVVIDFEKDEAAGLFAVMANTPGSVSPEAFTKGQEIYAWFYQNVQKLAVNYDQETAVKYSKQHHSKR